MITDMKCQFRPHTLQDFTSKENKVSTQATKIIQNAITVLLKPRTNQLKSSLFTTSKNGPCSTNILPRINYATLHLCRCKEGGGGKPQSRCDGVNGSLQHFE